MNLLIVSREDFRGEKLVQVKDRRFRHLKDTLKIRNGDRIKAGILNGNLGTGIVKELQAESALIELELSQAPPPPLPLTLVMALPRPKSLKKAIHAAVSCGVKEIFIIESWKVEKSYWQTPVLNTKNLHDESLLALEQSCDTIMPEIKLRRLFKPFIEDEIPGIIKGKNAYLADPHTKNSNRTEIKSPAALAVGPEGGFTEYEVEKFISAGFTPLLAGERILRVECAIPALIGKMFL